MFLTAWPSDCDGLFYHSCCYWVWGSLSSFTVSYPCLWQVHFITLPRGRERVSGQSLGEKDFRGFSKGTRSVYKTEEFYVLIMDCCILETVNLKWWKTFWFKSLETGVRYNSVDQTSGTWILISLNEVSPVLYLFKQNKHSYKIIY